MNISVIIPVYNAEKFITKAVDSALQFEEVKEVILIEDKSPDNAFFVCKELVKKDSRVKLFQHPNGVNRGAGVSRNLGIEKATQDYIAFLDADDFFLPNRFEKDKEIFKNHPDADGTYSAMGVHFHSEAARKQFEWRYSNKDGSNYLTTLTEVVPPEKLFEALIHYKKGKYFYIGHLHLNGITFKKSALTPLKGDWFTETRVMHEDAIFIWRLSYYNKLYAASIHNAVAMRGVHEENRITANDADELKKNNNRYIQFSILYDWGKKEKIDTNILKFFQGYKAYFDITKEVGLIKLIIFLKHIVITPGFMTNDAFKSSRKEIKRLIKSKIRR